MGIREIKYFGWEKIDVTNYRAAFISVDQDSKIYLGCSGSYSNNLSTTNTYYSKDFGANFNLLHRFVTASTAYYTSRKTF